MNWDELRKHLVVREFDESSFVYRTKGDEVYRYFIEVGDLAANNLPTYKVQWKQPQKPVEVNTDELMEILL